MTDHINPQHYRSHPSGVECIEITEHMNFCLGNAVKYIWRAGLKSDDPVEDLRKARWYITRELDRLGAERVVRPYATGGVLNALNKLNDQLDPTDAQNLADLPTDPDETVEGRYETRRYERHVSNWQEVPRD